MRIPATRSFSRAARISGPLQMGRADMVACSGHAVRLVATSSLWLATVASEMFWSQDRGGRNFALVGEDALSLEADHRGSLPHRGECRTLYIWRDRNWKLVGHFSAFLPLHGHARPYCSNLRSAGQEDHR